ncbi:dihydrofolate reductase family protein [Nocardia grenadensis]|uniref:dihydrofolate reductase family protein n=1 Tax=Nocardia grenadensis TaxID=931537 RepID=UPI003D756F5E
MRRLVAHNFVTLDGVAAPDAVVDDLVALRDIDEVFTAFFARVAEEDAMLLGRVTYQEWAQHWPGVTGQPFAEHINSVPKYVASTTLEQAPWGSGPDASVLGGDLRTAVGELKRGEGGPIGVHGSPTLVESLIRSGLVDELRLEIFPLLAGRGARLFRDSRTTMRLRLLESHTMSNGVIVASYGPHAS